MVIKPGIGTLTVETAGKSNQHLHKANQQKGALTALTSWWAAALTLDLIKQGRTTPENDVAPQIITD